MARTRAYLTGVTVGFEGLPMEMVGDLINPTKTTKDEQFVTVTPDDPPRRIKQVFVDSADLTRIVARDEARQAKEMADGTLVVVDADAVKEARRVSDLPERRLDLRIFRRSEVESRLCVGGKGYVFEPSGAAVLYGVVQRFLRERPEYVLMGRINLGARSGEKIMQFSTGVAGNLMVSELVWPEDVVEFETPTWDVVDKVYDTSVMILEASVAEFDPTEWEKAARQRLRDLVASGTPVHSPVAPERSLEEALAEALAAIERKTA